ncbi:MAG TPA: c-type cytochrome [Vicinamibacterales bacterium]
MTHDHRDARAFWVALGTFAVCGASLFAQSSVPPWAYGYFSPAAAGEQAPACTDPQRAVSCARPAAPVPDDGVLRKLPGTDRTFTRNQSYFDYGPADWYPGDHPSMPPIVANGREKEGVRACALCHYPNGKGKMENAQVAGLSAGYILQQLADFKNGVRRSADPRKANTNEMIAIAKALTDAEAQAAAAYFASMKWTPWVRVVEADDVPKVRATENGLFLPVAGAGTEPLGERIIEVPENPDRTNIMRDPRSGFVAYVPRGSIKKGEALVTTGAGKTTECAICHGDDLQGLGNVPGIAGRTASYTARQLFDFKAGTRNGTDAQLMKPVLARLNDADLLAITAYLSSRLTASQPTSP